MAKRQKRVKGIPVSYDEVKNRVSLTLTPTATTKLDETASEYGVSRSELVEQIARGIIPLASPNSSGKEIAVQDYSLKTTTGHKIVYFSEWEELPSQQGVYLVCVKGNNQPRIENYISDLKTLNITPNINLLEVFNEFSDERIRAALIYVKAMKEKPGSNIKNLSGYLVDAIRNGRSLPANLVLKRKTLPEFNEWFAWARKEEIVYASKRCSKTNQLIVCCADYNWRLAEAMMAANPLPRSAIK